MGHRTGAIECWHQRGGRARAPRQTTQIGQSRRKEVHPLVHAATVPSATAVFNPFFNNPISERSLETTPMKISGSERFMAALGYLAFLFIVPVKLRRDSMFVQFHARQGGVLFGLFILFMLVDFIVLLFMSEFPVVQTILIGALYAAVAVYLLMALIGLLKVALGERYRMPVVADVALLLRL